MGIINFELLLFCLPCNGNGQCQIRGFAHSIGAFATRTDHAWLHNDFGGPQCSWKVEGFLWEIFCFECSCCKIWKLQISLTLAYQKNTANIIHTCLKWPTCIIILTIMDGPIQEDLGFFVNNLRSIFWYKSQKIFWHPSWLLLYLGIKMPIFKEIFLTKLNESPVLWRRFLWNLARQTKSP